MAKKHEWGNYSIVGEEKRVEETNRVGETIRRLFLSKRKNKELAKQSVGELVSNKTLNWKKITDKQQQENNHGNRTKTQKELESAVADVRFDEKFAVHSKEGWQELQKVVGSRARQLSQLGAKVRAALTRITRSRNSEQLACEQQRLEREGEKISVLQKFNMSWP